jgi:hypothetical protein
VPEIICLLDQRKIEKVIILKLGDESGTDIIRPSVRLTDRPKLEW